MVFSKNKIDTAKIELRKYLHNDNLSLKQIDTINTKNNKVLKESVKIIKYCIKHNLTDKIINETIAKDDRYLNLYLNLEYNDRELIGDNPSDIDDKFYGGNNIQINQEKLTNHATYVAGVLGVKRINNNIKIMPIVISPNGDEHDKDIALAIKYAVDNGANIINMSSSKEFSLHEEWVHKALKYAAKNDVLFITSGGNNAYNIDTNKIYPNDVDKNEKEIVNTFINVGASTYNLNKNLRASFSNFGSENIDLFAPGKDIYTTAVNNKYDYIDGTSFATPIVSRVAVLILSYYPNLKAHQVKEILLASGVSYDIEVEITDENGKKKLVPFSSLSKSGKIVNAYNALLYAKNYKKWKKGKWSKK